MGWLTSRYGIKTPKKAGDPLSLGKKKHRKLIVGSLMFGAASLTLVQLHSQIAPGQQQIATRVETKADYLATAKDVVVLSVVIFVTSGTSYTRPADWNTTNSVECIAGGGNGSASTVICFCGPVWGSGSGGVGGSYSKSVNLNIGATATYAIGAAAGDTYFNATSAANAVTLGATVACAAKGASTSTASNTGTVKFGGGAGVAGASGGAGGGGAGGGAGGPNAAGGAGSVSTGGRGDGTFGGTGGAIGVNGNPGAEYTATAGGTAGSGGGAGGGPISSGAATPQGGLYGGGGGGGGGGGLVQAFAGGAGRQGLIVITYAPISGTAQPFQINLAMLGF